MNHYYVEINGFGYVVAARSQESAEYQALRSYLTGENIEITRSHPIYCPCQWGDPCPGIFENCGQCAQKMGAK